MEDVRKPEGTGKTVNSPYRTNIAPENDPALRWTRFTRRGRAAVVSFVRLSPPLPSQSLRADKPAASAATLVPEEVVNLVIALFF